MEVRPDFSEIQPLLIERKVDKERNTLRCVFMCPVTHKKVAAQAFVQQGQGFADRMLDAASRSFWYELRSTVAQRVCSFLPHGFLREVAQGAAWRMSYSSDDHITSGAELEQATVEAFMSVREQFERDGKQWRSREVVTEFVTDFERHLRAFPVNTKYDSEILSRVLAVLATTDGLEQAEEFFLLEQLGDFVGSDESRPSRVELSELTSEVKPTVYLLASALALVDQEKSTSETAYLRELEADLGLGKEDASRLRRAAGQFIVEQTAALSGHPSSEEIARLARLAELSTDEVERVLIRRRKRH